jgi:chorismate mutase
MVDELGEWRDGIDNIDNQLGKLLEERFDLCKKIGEYKKDNCLKITNNNREKEIINRICRNTNLSEDFVKDLFGLIIGESKKIQRRKNGE